MTNFTKNTYFHSFIIIFIATFCLIALVLVPHEVKDIPLHVITDDLVKLGHVPFYAGFLSQAGLMLWSATIAVCILGIIIVEQANYRSFFIVSGLITFILLLDDSFMFHESIAPMLGFEEKKVFLTYGVMVLVFLIVFRKIILKTQFLTMGLAFVFFAVSIMVDLFFQNYSQYITKLLEDGAKIAGIVSWLVYFMFTCKDLNLELKSTGLVSV